MNSRFDLVNMAIVGGFAAVLALIGTGVYAYYNPSHAAWRQFCVQGHNTYHTEWERDSTSGQVEPHTVTDYVCDLYQWKCIAGRDGSTMCEGRPS
jgi:hypothetical protein